MKLINFIGYWFTEYAFMISGDTNRKLPRWHFTVSDWECSENYNGDYIHTGYIVRFKRAYFGALYSIGCKLEGME